MLEFCNHSFSPPPKDIVYDMYISRFYINVRVYSVVELESNLFFLSSPDPDPGLRVGTLSVLVALMCEYIIMMIRFCMTFV